MNLKVDKEDFKIDLTLDDQVSSYHYGEANYLSIYEIIKKYYFENCNFIDIGSGSGKIVIYLVNKLNINADGVEIEPSRYLKSLKLLEKYDLYHKIEFYNQDFNEIYFGNYDILYCCNLIFTEEDNKKLYNKIISEFKGIVLLMDYDYELQKHLLEYHFIKTSWNKGQYIFVFKIV